MAFAKSSITILLSTFNGAPYLKECLDSLLSQTYSNFTILIRDDGSTDQTVTILKEYERINKSIRVHAGENVGIVESFFEILAMAEPTEYYSFCDQDDVWKPEKIERGIERLQRLDHTLPTLYCGPVYITDKNLKLLGKSRLPCRGPSFTNALIQNIAQGCSIIINQSASELINKARPETEQLTMFDWWLYLLISGVGTVVYDDEAYVDYRQHESNLVGMSRSSVQNKLRTLSNLFFTDDLARTVSQANQLKLYAYDLLPPEVQQVLTRFLDSRRSFFTKINYAFFGKARRQTILGTIAYRLALILR